MTLNLGSWMCPRVVFICVHGFSVSTVGNDCVYSICGMFEGSLHPWLVGSIKL